MIVIILTVRRQETKLQLCLNKMLEVKHILSVKTDTNNNQQQDLQMRNE